MLKNYIVILIWNLFIYFLGILCNYLKLDIFEIHIFNLFITFYTFLFSFPYIILDENKPINTLKKLYNLNVKDKRTIMLSCLPVSNFIIISYIDLDSVIIQLLLTTSIIVNLIISSLYNLNYKLLNKKIILLIIINISGCIIPLLLNDDFTFKLNNNKIGMTGLINTIIIIILSAIVTTLNEKIKNINFDYNKECYTFIIFTYLLIELILFIILTPIFYLIQFNLINNYKINTNIIKDIILYSSFIAIIYNNIYINTTIFYINLTSFDIGIIKNINFIITILISCLIGISKFYYLYILSLVFVIFSSILIIFIKNKINNTIEMIEIIEIHNGII